MGNLYIDNTCDEEALRNKTLACRPRLDDGQQLWRSHAQTTQQLPCYSRSIRHRGAQRRGNNTDFRTMESVDFSKSVY